MIGTPLGDPYLTNAAYEQGKADRCVKVVCGIILTVLFLAILIWLLLWLFRPAPPIIVARPHYHGPRYYHMVNKLLSSS
jgi:hypothetical protein